MGGEVRKKVREKGKGEREGVVREGEKVWRERKRNGGEGEGDGEGREIENRKIMGKKEEEEAEVDKKQQLYIAGLLRFFFFFGLLLSFLSNINTDTQKHVRTHTLKKTHGIAHTNTLINM